MGDLRVISVTSGKGGVGKSHLAANIAALCAKRGQRTLAIDADSSLANLDVLFGVAPKRHVGHLFDGAMLDEVLTSTSSGVALLAASPGERRMVHLSLESKNTLLCAWDALADDFDVVIVDAGPGVGDDVLFFASCGQQVIVVVTDEPTSIADAAVLIRELRGRSALRQVDVVVNGVRSSKIAQSVYGRLQTALADVSLMIRYLGHVPDDQNVRRAAMAQRPLVELAPTSPASRAFDRITDALLEQTVRSSGGVSIGVTRQMKDDVTESVDEGCAVNVGTTSASERLRHE